MSDPAPRRFAIHADALSGEPGQGERRLGLVRGRRIRPVPLRVILPNLVTLLALSMGLTGIRFAIEGQFQVAVLVVIIAAVLDGLDGRLARALRGTTRFGAELDSLADFVDFGVAPGLILYLWNLHQMKSFGWFAALVFAIACALRLARFNIALDDPTRPKWESSFFIGMPAPAGAVLGLLPLYLNFSGLGVLATRMTASFEIGYVLFIAFLMASRIPHFSVKKIGRIPREYVLVVLFAIAAVALLLATFPMEVLACLSLLYLATIPFAVLKYRAFAAAEAADALQA